MAKTVPKVTVHHLNDGQCIYANIACVSNILSAVLHSAAQQ